MFNVQSFKHAMERVQLLRNYRNASMYRSLNSKYRSLHLKTHRERVHSYRQLPKLRLKQPPSRLEWRTENRVMREWVRRKIAESGNATFNFVFGSLITVVGIVFAFMKATEKPCQCSAHHHQCSGRVTQSGEYKQSKERDKSKSQCDEKLQTEKYHTLRFHSAIKPWEQIASDHINRVAAACKEFVFEVLQHAAPAEFHAALAAINVDVAINVDAALANSLKKAKKEQSKILKDKARHPSAYNHYFTDTIQKIRQRKHQKLTKDAQENSQITIREHSGSCRNTIDPTKFKEETSTSIERDMDTFSSQEALDAQRAFYKDELKYFVNTVARAVIERHLVEPLPEVILFPVTVTQMSEREIEFVAATPCTAHWDGVKK